MLKFQTTRWPNLLCHTILEVGNDLLTTKSGTWVVADGSDAVFGAAEAARADVVVTDGRKWYNPLRLDPWWRILFVTLS